MSELYDSTLVSMQKQFPKFKLVPKSESGFMKFLDVLLKIVTFGTNNHFMKSVTTTIGYTVYIPENWFKQSSINRVCLLKHESVHMEQRSKLGWFAFYFLYLFIPLPFLFAYYRTKFEKDGYREELKQMMIYYGPEILDSQDTKDDIISQFNSSTYLWMWVIKSSIIKWYDQTIKELKESQPES